MPTAVAIPMDLPAAPVPRRHPITVTEFWIVDIPGRHLDCHREPDSGRYTQQFRVHDLARVGIGALPAVVLDPRALF